MKWGVRSGVALTIVLACAGSPGVDLGTIRRRNLCCFAKGHGNVDQPAGICGATRPRRA
jgi:hypothetical protein